MEKSGLKSKKIDYKIQSIVFPSDDKHLQCRRLFYRGDHAILDRESGLIRMGYAQRCDFVTYLNACSYQKWRTYANVGKLTLHLELSGKLELDFIGYSKRALTVTRTDMGAAVFESKERREFCYEFPENNEQMVGFEVTALEKTTIYGGYYTVEVNENDINDVVLSLATTTCKKEEFIKKNISLLSNEILDGNDDIADNLYVHVVDNGQTLTDEDIHGKHVCLHRNINAGGSGGFARGMMESLYQKPKVTHVLLMDDDVLVLSESIRRTYNLLRLIKPEYKDHFISGAMLYYENPSFQHEDIGTVDVNGYDCRFKALKGVFNHQELADNLENERFYPYSKNSYAAWWYCCIPVDAIKKNGLPLPIFIRVDDMEYALRCKARIITMNGICVWHMGFVTKYNGVFDRYQQLRNLPITQSTSHILNGLDFMPAINHYFRVEMLRFNYNCAELIIDALEDYNKGPSLIMNTPGEKLTLGKMRLNDIMKPLSDLGTDEISYQDCYIDEPRKLKDRVVMKLTWNGQRFTPRFMDREGVVPITADPNMQPQKITLRVKLLAVNPYDRTGVYRVRDKKKFRELMKRYKKAVKYYRRHRSELRSEYRNAFREMTSERFWREYLNLEDR